MLKNKVKNTVINTLNIKLNKTKMKSLFSSSVYFIIIIAIINIIFSSIVLSYLSKIDSCKCYNEENKLNYSNIKYLIIIEIIIILINSLLLLFLLYMLFAINVIMKGGGENQKIYLYIPFIIGLIIYSYFAYNVYKFSENVKLECKCTQSTLRYLLYIQSVWFFFGLFMGLYINNLQ
jgi:hypothetical protein